MKKHLLLLFGALLITGSLFSQANTVSGVVTSVEGGLGVPGVTVQIKGTIRGTSTDLDGKYTLLDVLPDDVIMFSFIGFETQEVTVGDKSEISIVLKPGAANLDEVVITALGIKRQKRELGFATEKVDGAVTVQSSTANVLSAIKGRAAGVQVTDGDGVEGGSTRITIRGNNNIFSNNQPLIVVDGIPMENVPGLESIGRGRDWGSAINNINAFDIEDQTILKGGPATAKYGSRGANGVIEIRTKRGSKQKGLGVQYNFSYKFSNPYRYRNVQNTYGHGGPVSFSPTTFPTAEEGDTITYPDVYQYNNDFLVLNQDGLTSTSNTQFGYYGSAVSWGPKMEGQMMKWWNGEMRSWSPQPDNMEIAMQNGYTMTNNVSASGGNEKGSFRLSVTRLDHQPIIENSEYDQTTIALGTTLKLSDKISTDVAVSFIKYNRLNSPMVGDDQSSFSKGHLYSWGRSYQGADRDNYELETGEQNPQSGFPYSFINPHLWWNFYNNNTNLTRDIYTASISLTYDITSWLSAYLMAGRDFNLTQSESRSKPTDYLGFNGSYGNGLSRHIGNNYDAMLTATKDKIFNSKFDIDFTVGGAAVNIYDYGMRGGSGKWYYPNYYTFANYTETTYDVLIVGNSRYTIVDESGNSAGSVRPTESISRRRTNSFYSFLTLSYNDYLYLDITGRNDWTSTLPDYANSYFYPSASLSFIASDAFRIQESVYWINFLKIRGGIAETATDMAPYQSEAYFSVGRYGGEQTSALDNTIPPIRLKPQRVKAYEAGVNIGLFENRIDFDFTYYYFYSYDQLMGLPLPPSSGASYVRTNDAELTNQGIEITLNGVPFQTSDFFCRTGINFSRNRNEVVSLGSSGAPLILAEIWGGNGPGMIVNEGEEYGTIFGWDYVYHENGQPILNEAGTHYQLTDTRVPIGNASPHFLAGWFTEFDYKGFALSTLIDTKWGGEIYSGSYVIMQQTGQSPSTLIERDGGGLPYTDPEGNTSNVGVILPGVYEDGTPNDKVVHYYYKYLPNAGGWGNVISTPGVLENSWVKLREIAFSYTFPQRLVQKTKAFQKLKISLVGRDICYIYSSLPDNINPEGIMGSGNAQGFEWASFPGVRSFTVSLSANF